jgi:hypothetical protein
MASVDQFNAGMGTDKTGAAGDKNGRHKILAFVVRGNSE